MDRLKPCPFCGGTIGFHKEATGHTEDCYFMQPRGSVFDTEHMVTAWNRRATSAQQDAPTDAELVRKHLGRVTPNLMRDALTLVAAARYASAQDAEQARDALLAAKDAEIARLDALINNPHTDDFLEGVKLEAAHQRGRWGDAHDRSKSAENWFWLVGYLSGKCLRAVITGDHVKAQHHTISSAAALANWHEAIKRDTSGIGAGVDADLARLDSSAGKGE